MSTEHDMKDSTTAHTTASSVLARIQSEGITPTPRWHFLAREGTVWSLGGVAVSLGSLAIAAIIFVAFDADWDYYEATHDNLLTFAVAVMPYTWLVVLLIFGVIAYESVRHTKRGYRYPLMSLLAGSVGLSMLGGSALYFVGAGPYIDTQLGSHIPMHQSLAQLKLGFWNQPERGVMAGLVTDVATTGESFTLQTPDNVAHIIRTNTLSQETRDEIKIGTAMRVVAPRKPHTGGRTKLRTSTRSASSTAPSAALLTTLGTKQDPEEMAEINDACLVLPLNVADIPTQSVQKRSLNSETRDKCFKELREVRQKQGDE